MKELKKLTKEELIEKALKQNKEIDAKRGYESGITKRMLEKMNYKTILDCYMENKKRFGI